MINVIETKKTYNIITYGCQANEHDSEKIAYLLDSMGYIYDNNKEDAHIVVYNTCMVRENAELKLLGQLGAMKAIKRSHPDRVLIVCGCMMQTGQARELVQQKYPHVDIIFGTRNISSLPELMAKHEQTKELVWDIEEATYTDVYIPATRSNSYQAYVDIMHGCNNFCSYCIVPYARGRETSRSHVEILEEINDLANKGYKEVTLLGQNVNSYGKDLASSIEFPELLRRVNDVEGIERIRFMTSHPKDMSDELIIAMTECSKVCNHLHLPFQAGSDRILTLMNRKYTRTHYLSLIQKLRAAIPDICLSTDVIVGFPGETEEDFEETLSLVREVGFDLGFTFLYSKREGTKAALMEDGTSDEIKNARFQRLLDEMYPIYFEKNAAYIGQTVDVLVEGVSKNNETVMTGRTDTFKLVHFPGDRSLIGQIVQVKIKGNTSFTLEGHLC